MALVSDCLYGFSCFQDLLPLMYIRQRSNNSVALMAAFVFQAMIYCAHALPRFLAGISCQILSHHPSYPSSQCFEQLKKYHDTHWIHEQALILTATVTITVLLSKLEHAKQLMCCPPPEGWPPGYISHLQESPLTLLQHLSLVLLRGQLCSVSRKKAGEGWQLQLDLNHQSSFKGPCHTWWHSYRGFLLQLHFWSVAAYYYIF